MYAFRIFLSGLIFLVSLAAPLAMAQTETRFFSVPNDMPLMPGLSELPARATAFDKPEGRIAEASAAGRISAVEIKKFYETLLPQLGWKRGGGDFYVRQDEQLAMRTGTENGMGVVRFSIAPR